MMPLLLAAAAAFSGCVPAAPLLDQGYRQMYNLQFAAAHKSFAQFEKEHPKDPMGPASDAAAYLFAEFDRLKILRSEMFASNQALFDSKPVSPDRAIEKKFDADLEKAKALAETAQQRAPDDPAAMFSTVLRLALRADYDALIAKRYWKSMGEIEKAQKEAGALEARRPDCYDAELATGFENYILSYKPAPVRWLLSLTGAQTDRERGIQQLRTVAEKGHFLKPYAKVLLAIAALRQGDKQQAKDLLASLAQEFPNNDLFKAELRKLS
jgi:hypothetical protein